MKFATEVYRGTLENLNDLLDSLAAQGWTIVSVGLHSTLIDTRTHESSPLTDWLICKRK